MEHRTIYALSLAVLILLIGEAAFAEGTLPAEPEPELKLVGTAVSSGHARSLAVIENRATGNQGAFWEGDRLGEYLVKKILVGQVIIDTGSGEFVLTMRSFVRAGGPEPETQTGQLDAEEVDAAIPDYSQFMQAIRVRPRFEEGKPGGFVIYRIEPGSIFAQMGLQDGDVVKAVNEKPILTTQQAEDFYDAIMEYDTVSLDIVRDNLTKKLLFEIR